MNDHEEEQENRHPKRRKGLNSTINEGDSFFDEEKQKLLDEWRLRIDYQEMIFRSRQQRKDAAKWRPEF